MIRSAREMDRGALLSLHLASWRDAYAPFLPRAYLGAPLAADLGTVWQARALAPPLLTLVFGQVEGFICGMTDRNPPYIDNLHVSPAQRGLGIGHALMMALFEHVRAEGHTACALTVLEGNAAARRFYARHGGLEGAVRDAELFGHPIREVPVTFDLRGLSPSRGTP